MNHLLHIIIEVMKGVPSTLVIAIVAMIVGLLVGTLFAIIRLNQIPILSPLIVVYNSFFRSTPLIVQLLMFYYGIPAFILWLNDTFNLGFNPDVFSPLTIALIAFSLHAIAYLSESMRGGLQSVETTQIEAAESIGLSKWNTYRRIVLPQALGYALPNIENQFIMLLKGTSLAFVIQVTEIMARSTTIANESYQFIPVYTVAAILYWLLAIVLEMIFHQTEAHTSRYLDSSQAR